ncbi:hypothetical protein [Amycolatopsis decaplanina]|uniref:Uncharacterized protein n=1 Tax=Amycolatopsis decaplanina DSM 44594 TaxID=1284240 RepID=M2ZRL1_9PSEU|nr:hypothetical protein [Amycolatopsis decaplanina]EME63438.1 hypothetical protein H074_06052 [Amycolatopsis decaplanina DSM 44594]
MIPRDCTPLGLALAVLAAVAVVILPAPAPAVRAPAVPSVTDVWPGARITAHTVTGPPYTPLAYLDSETSAGVARASDSIRLTLGDRVLREVPLPGSPRFVLAVSPEALVWLELSDITGTGALWRAGPRGENPVLVTADTGRVVLQDSQYDLVVHEDQAGWVAVRGDATEVRTVALSGGPVNRTPLPGDFALTAWPFATSAAVEQAGPSELVDLRDGRVARVGGQNVELVDCTPSWCRVQVLRQSGTARFDLMKPDGSERRRVGGKGIRPAFGDVVVLDRYAVVVDDDRGVLALYDTATGRMADLAAEFGTVLARGPYVWWSEGENEALTWRSLDLRTLEASA